MEEERDAGTSRQFQPQHLTFLFKKQFVRSDTDHLCKLTIPTKDAEACILPWYGITKPDCFQEMDFPVFALDSEKIEHFKFVYWKSANTFVVRSGWSEYVKRRGLGANDSVMFFLTTNNSICISSCRHEPIVEEDDQIAVEGLLMLSRAQPEKDDGKKSIYECKTCNKKFQSFRALGGHRSSCHKSEGHSPNKRCRMSS